MPRELDNSDAPTVASFGQEWTTSRQEVRSCRWMSGLPFSTAISDIFPWDSLPPTASEWTWDAAVDDGRSWSLPASDICTSLTLARTLYPSQEPTWPDTPNVSFHVASVADLPVRGCIARFRLRDWRPASRPRYAARPSLHSRKLKPQARRFWSISIMPSTTGRLVPMALAPERCLRIVLSRSPAPLRYAASQAIAAIVYWPLARTAALLDAIGIVASLGSPVILQVTAHST